MAVDELATLVSKPLDDAVAREAAHAAARLQHIFALRSCTSPPLRTPSWWPPPVSLALQLRSADLEAELMDVLRPTHAPERRARAAPEPLHERRPGGAQARARRPSGARAAPTQHQGVA